MLRDYAAARRGLMQTTVESHECGGRVIRVWGPPRSQCGCCTADVTGIKYVPYLPRWTGRGRPLITLLGDGRCALNIASRRTEQSSWWAIWTGKHVGSTLI